MKGGEKTIFPQSEWLPGEKVLCSIFLVKKVTAPYSHIGSFQYSGEVLHELDKIRALLWNLLFLTVSQWYLQYQHIFFLCEVLTYIFDSVS